MPKKRTILLMATTMLFAVLVVGGVAFALDFACNGPGDPHPGGTCTGTSQNDTISGTPLPDIIDARSGDDLVFGEGGADTIHGANGTDTLFGANPPGADLNSDVLYGEGLGDELVGGGGNNQYFGGSGPDLIRANQSQVSGGVETVSAGRGDDVIFAVDLVRDTIDCGSGTDRYMVDPIDDFAANCEIGPIFP
jgi:Ca2+-binding RTX toxin-like protein